MHARLSRFAGLPTERIDDTLTQFREGALPAFKQLPGYKGVLVAVNYAEGKAAAVTFWETADNMRASDKLADQARDAALAQAQGSSEPTREPIVDHYEVLLDER